MDDISPIFLSILIIGLGLWVFYGLLISDIPIILTNGVSFTLNGIMLFLYYTTKK
ncbi:SemiSWEET family transporter [Galbibacter marinus]|uniref:SemiSWEET family transporter n=1 Tax=Galbibacter marinus TaxID=555500 RepID=UPI0002E5D53E|nr:SemiSWEET family transporter [Galbibacter marinus]